MTSSRTPIGAPSRPRFLGIALGVALSLAAASPVPLLAQDAAQTPAAAPVPARSVTTGTVTIDGETVEYEATFGSTILRGGDDQPTGELFYTAYRRLGMEDLAERPVMFSYNGGPGSASMWLHMGIMGPRRIDMPDVSHPGGAPYRIVDNEFSLLDETDIVMIDPIGTGLSRPLGDTPGSEFWGVDEDSRSLTQFISRWLSENGRWMSPKYLLGESYGTTRSAVLASDLQGANIDLNGVVLVSAVLDFQTILFNEGNDMPYVLYLPSYALTAEYAEAIPDQPDLQAFMTEVEEFALNDYATALLRAGNLAQAERERILDRLVEYTGLDREYLDRADLRVTASEFFQELLRDRGEIVGRLDARYSGPTGDLLAQTPDQDPQSSAISGSYTAAINHYIRQELGYEGEGMYRPSGGVNPWNWTRIGSGGWPGHLNVTADLGQALRRNPNMEVLLLNGIYDLATPYFAAVWGIDRMLLEPELRDNIQRVDFEAGHMMYVQPESRVLWKQVLDEFIEGTH